MWYDKCICFAGVSDTVSKSKHEWASYHCCHIAQQHHEWSKPPEDTFNHVLLKNPHA